VEGLLFEVDVAEHPVPREVAQGFNWGAFLLPVIWGGGNGAYWAFWGIPLTCTGPGKLLFAVYCGARGNAWAWENGEYATVEQFRATQRRWAVAGLVWNVLLFLVVGAVGWGSAR